MAIRPKSAGFPGHVPIEQRLDYARRETEGRDHKKLTHRYNGRDFRLTDVFGNVIQEVLA